MIREVTGCMQGIFEDEYEVEKKISERNGKVAA